ERSGANALLFAKGSGIQRPKRPYESAVAGEMADGTSLGIVRLSAMHHVPFAMLSSGVGRDGLRPGLGMGMGMGTGTGPLPVIGDDVLESLLQDVGGPVADQCADLGEVGDAAGPCPRTPPRTPRRRARGRSRIGN